MFSNRQSIVGMLLLLTGLLAAGFFRPFDLIKTSSAQTGDYDHEEVIERSFKVESGQRLYLDSDLGSVKVRGDGGHEVVIRVVKGANDMSRRDAEELFERFDLSFDQTSNGVSIDGEYEGERSWRRGRNLRVEFEIAVPHDFDVRVKTAGGSLYAEDIAGDIDLKTAGGSVTTLDLDGPLSVETSGGSIRAETISGPARLHTSGGSITARDINGEVDCNTSGGGITVERAGGDVSAHTSGGSINLREIEGTANAHTSGGSIRAELLTAPDGPMKLETSGGSITLQLAANTHVDIDARASGGNVRTDLPVVGESNRSKTNLRGTINGGGPLLTLRSSGGGVRIQER
jgi:hypothetical protein